jgi:hypothetical protein
MTRAYLCIVLACTASTQLAAQPLGRLFFTPEERAALDSSRGQKNVAGKSVSANALEASPTPQVITLNGLVRRSDGKSTVWLNHSALTERDMLKGRPVIGNIRTDGTITLRAPHSGASFDLKVGQRAELLSGRDIRPVTPATASAPEPGNASEKMKSAPAHAR